MITFHGFLKAYVEGIDEGAAEDDAETRLPALAEGDAVSAASVSASGHETKPPARYTEATLIKELEDREIGRPSTYASIIGTILNRGYVYKKGTALVPAWLAFSVVRLLEEHFPRQISYEFTADMEDVLDDIAAGRKDRDTELGEFYYGSGDIDGLQPLVDGLGDIDARELATFPIGGPEAGIDLRVGRYGPYLEGPGDDGTPAGKRANVPDDLPPDELTLEKAEELFANPAGEEIELGVHPETGLQVVAKNGRYGPYVTEVLPEDAPKTAKPRTGSLFKSMSLDTVTLDDAVKLLSLPRVVGERPRERRGDHRAERPLRAVPEEGHRLALAGERGPALHDHPRRGAGDLRPAQAARPGRGGAAAEGAGQRPGLRAADRGQGRPLRRVRHRRRVQRHPAQGRHGRGDHPRARRRAAGGAPRAGPAKKAAKKAAKKTPREEGRREEGPGQEGGREEGTATKTAAKKTTKKAAADPE